MLISQQLTTNLCLLEVAVTINCCWSLTLNNGYSTMHYCIHRVASNQSHCGPRSVLRFLLLVVIKQCVMSNKVNVVFHSGSSDNRKLHQGLALKSNLHIHRLIGTYWCSCNMRVQGNPKVSTHIEPSIIESVQYLLLFLKKGSHYP